MTDRSELEPIARRILAAYPFGALHIVVDDGNMEDENIRYCLGLDDIQPEEIALANDLLAMPEDDRIEAWELAQFIAGGGSR